MAANSISVWRSADLKYIELQRGISVTQPVRRHWHDEYQFVFVESGGGDLTYRRRNIFIPPTSLYVVHPGEIHSNRAFDSEGICFRTLFLDTRAMSDIVAEVSDKTTALPFFSPIGEFDREMIRQFVDLHRCFERTASTFERKSRLYRFLGRLISLYSDRCSYERPPRIENNLILQARDYLIANTAERVSLEELARISNLSPFHFNRVFSEQVGMPPHEFHLQARLSQAKRLLHQGMEIAQVASLTGFADQSHLSRHFRRLLGITPGQYKNGSKNVQDFRTGSVKNDHFQRTKGVH